MRVRTVVLEFFCLIVYTRRQKSVIITETLILARKPLYYQAKVDTRRQNPYTNTETAREFSCLYKGFRDSMQCFRDSTHKNDKNILQNCFCLKTFLFSAKLYQYNLRTVIEAERYDAVANAAADDHVRAAICIQPCIKFGEQSLIGCNQPADEGQAELAAMCMAA